MDNFAARRSHIKPETRNQRSSNSKASRDQDKRDIIAVGGGSAESDLVTVGSAATSRRLHQSRRGGLPSKREGPMDGLFLFNLRVNFA